MITREFPPEPGGISYYVYNLSKKLTEKGHEVCIITRGGARTLIERMDGITVYRVSFFPVYPFHLWLHGLFINNIFKYLEPNFDIIHIHSPLVPQIKTSLPIMTTVHTPMKVDSRFHEVFNPYSFAEKAQSSIFSPIAEASLFQHSTMINAVSSTVAEELKTYNLNLEKIDIIRNGVDEKIFIPIKEKNANLKYVLYTGILRARKGLFDLLQCAEYVCKRDTDVIFLVCGRGPFFQKLTEEIHKRGMNDRFKLLGYVKRSELIKLYSNATVHVVPSHYEGLPTVLLEAMSCGLPVVATNIGGNREVIIDGVNGLLVPPKNPQALGNAILRLLNDEQLRVRLGKAARITIENHYTWDNIACNIIDCYEKILSQKGSKKKNDGKTSQTL